MGNIPDEKLWDMKWEHLVEEYIQEEYRWRGVGCTRVKMGREEDAISWSIVGGH